MQTGSAPGPHPGQTNLVAIKGTVLDPLCSAEKIGTGKFHETRIVVKQSCSTSTTVVNTEDDPAHADGPRCSGQHLPGHESRLGPQHRPTALLLHHVVRGEGDGHNDANGQNPPD